MIWTRSTDKYGRSVHTLRNSAMRSLGVVVKYPATTAHLFAPATHFTNDWAHDYEVVQHSSLKAAKAHLEAVNA